MKRYFKISLVIVVLALLIAIGSSVAYGFTGFFFGFGLTCVIGGAICLFLAAVIGMTGTDKDLAKAFLFSAGITFLIGTGACSMVALTISG